ncbi:Mycobacterium terramassiliense ORFan [Mycobacterium terramassiliense]|uniref:Mycobacterium terramassiliense ORFan n=1 Tax=Mycobacterium terramassiliense TaxID=1841859 RepID=A0A2U3N5F1_9MYCO|nr:Mycobacterium terramassiliense ORFan [Mycobacterium terramassiliense]
MQSVNDRIKDAAAGVAPSCGVQRYRELTVAAPIHTLERLDEPEKVGALVQPRCDEVC